MNASIQSIQVKIVMQIGFKINSNGTTFTKSKLNAAFLTENANQNPIQIISLLHIHSMKVSYEMVREIYNYSNTLTTSSREIIEIRIAAKLYRTNLTDSYVLQNNRNLFISTVCLSVTVGEVSFLSPYASFRHLIHCRIQNRTLRESDLDAADERRHFSSSWYSILAVWVIASILWAPHVA